MAPVEAQLSDCAYSTTPTFTPILSSTHSRRRSPEADRKPSSRDSWSCNHNPPRRNSAFLEVGLGGEDAIVDSKLRRESRPKLQVRFSSQVDFVEPDPVDWSDPSPASHLRFREQMPPYFPTLPRLLFLALVIVLVVPSLHTSPLLKAEANPVAEQDQSLKFGSVKRESLPQKSKRDDSPTVVCKRWSQQSALVNGTLYLYGGRASTSSDQTTDTWSMLCRPRPLSVLT